MNVFGPNRLATRTVVAGLAVCTAAVMAFPFIFMLSVSLKSVTDANSLRQSILPSIPPAFDNYIFIWKMIDFPRLFMNSAMVATVDTGFSVAFAFVAGYGFARYRFPGKRIIFTALLATMMIPGHMNLIAKYVQIVRWPLVGGNDILGRGGSGFVDTYFALIVPSLASVFMVFFFRQHFYSVPKDLEDAAKIDGCGATRMLSMVLIPISTAALGAMTVLQFLGSWNQYLWPLIVVNSKELHTIPLGLARLAGRDYAQMIAPESLAGTVIAMVPSLALLFAFGKLFIRQGIAIGGLKG